MALKLEFTMDNETHRHALNGHGVVMHSHHYLALITKLVEDFSDIGGPQILCEVVEESMRTILDDYFLVNSLSSAEDRCRAGEEYFSTFGLGKMHIAGNENGGEVQLTSSHIDEGWAMKWGAHSKPVNHLTRGFISAIFSAAFNKPPKSYDINETASIVTGQPESKFIVTAL
ncbi:MAG: hypothetical protein BA869_02145 [Desulfuromonadales bacterium C00003107]|nr:MAG: hypothetical protein BA869_02145 [Desulfuromonadales bacterium C00003107]